MVTTNHNDQVCRKQSQLFYMARCSIAGNSQQQFTALYGLLLWEPWLTMALEQVLTNPGAKTPGVDGITKGYLNTAESQQALVDRLRDELRTAQYRPQPAKRVYIPKANGTQRPLGIPTIRDRVVQAAVKNLLEPIFEADFEDCSYGFRPHRGCWDALAEIGQYLKRPSGYEWTIEGDIQDCFGSMDHKILMQQIRRRVRDPRLLTLIWHLLKAGVLEDLRYDIAETGTPQGGIVSPLLANIYLHQLDEWAARHSHRLTSNQKYHRRRKGQATLRLTRYADDFVIAVKGTRAQAEAIRTEVADLLRTKMRMTLNMEKTRITHRSEGFVFLGVAIRYGPSRKRIQADGTRPEYVYYQPSPHAIQRYKDKVRDLTSRQTEHRDAVEVIRAINRFSSGWANYYKHANSSKVFETLDSWMWYRVFHWLQNRYGVAPRAAARRFYVQANVPINCHPTRKDKRLGVRDNEGRLLAIWPLAFTPIRYWTYRGSKIPHKFEGGENRRTLAEQPTYEATPWPVGENAHHTAEYRNARESVRFREKFRCQNCGVHTRTGETHHKDGNPQNNDPENLELLCSQCHKATANYGTRKA